MLLVFIDGETELPPQHSCLPDVAQMVEDIDAASRAMHGGRLVLQHPDARGRSGIVHVFIRTFQFNEVA